MTSTDFIALLHDLLCRTPADSRQYGRITNTALTGPGLDGVCPELANDTRDKHGVCQTWVIAAARVRETPR